jgi:hypothetical protein
MAARKIWRAGLDAIDASGETVWQNIPVHAILRDS